MFTHLSLFLRPHISENLWKLNLWLSFRFLVSVGLLGFPSPSFSLTGNVSSPHFFYLFSKPVRRAAAARRAEAQQQAAAAAQAQPNQPVCLPICFLGIWFVFSIVDIHNIICFQIRCILVVYDLYVFKMWFQIWFDIIFRSLLVDITYSKIGGWFMG